MVKDKRDLIAGAPTSRHSGPDDLFPGAGIAIQRSWRYLHELDHGRVRSRYPADCLLALKDQLAHGCHLPHPVDSSTDTDSRGKLTAETAVGKHLQPEFGDRAHAWGDDLDPPTSTKNGSKLLGTIGRWNGLRNWLGRRRRK